VSDRASSSALAGLTSTSAPFTPAPPTACSPPAIPFLRREAAAEYLRTRWGIPCTVKTLANKFWAGDGPLVRKAGRIPLYEISGLDAYAAALLGPPLKSSSDRAAA
jgi:hypothetical protein